MSDSLSVVPSGGGGGDPPTFKRGLVDVTVPVGSDTKFLVEIHSPSQLTVEWYHNDTKVDDSDRTVLLSDRGLYCLQIREVTPRDEGRWSCRATNTSGGLSCFSLLKIQVPEVYRAPEFIKGLRGCLWDNGTLSLHCDVLGVPTPTLRWYRNGSELVAGSALIIKANSKESKSLMGIFSCEAMNCMGTKSTFSKVYAKNFAEFLRQCAHLSVPHPKYPVPMPKHKSSHTTITTLKDLDIDVELDDSGIHSNAQ